MSDSEKITLKVSDIKTPPAERETDHSPPSSAEELLEEQFEILENMLKSMKWDWVVVTHPEKRAQYERQMKGMLKQYKICEKEDSNRAVKLWNQYVKSPYASR